MTIENVDSAQAFEYVAGTLRGEERTEFIRRLRDSIELQAEVDQWQASLQSMNASVPSREPPTDTLASIHKRIGANGSRTVSESESQWWQSIFSWKLSTIVACMLCVTITGIWVVDNSQRALTESALNTDYVAVLTSESGAAVVTALTSSDGKTLWLKWENAELPEGQSVQLWAESRRDGEIRPLFVFEGDWQDQIALNQAEWRLIKDSSYLIATVEEPGGSSIDEPSDMLLARGICIRLSGERS